MNMVIYNHSRYLNIAFGGVVLGELISLAHDFHFSKGLLWKFSATIPENLGTLISFVCSAILWMYLQQAWANHKVFKTVSISSLIAMEGLFCLFQILVDKKMDWESASDGATLSFILLLFLFFAYLAINLYVGIVLIVKSERALRWGGILTIVDLLFWIVLMVNGNTDNPVLSFFGSLLLILLNFSLKEGCLDELDEDEVEIGILQYAQMAYVLFIPFLLICSVMF